MSNFWGAYQFACTYESVYLVLTLVSTSYSFLAVVIEEPQRGGYEECRA